MSYFKMCPICKYALTIRVNDQSLYLECKDCAYSEQTKGGLVHETLVKETNSKSYEILVNEFTRQEPTLPYMKDLKCHNSNCPSNLGSQEKKVYYLKYNDIEMKYIYLCANCDQTWTSR